jgi:hypothetical protein
MIEAVKIQYRFTVHSVKTFKVTILIGTTWVDIVNVYTLLAAHLINPQQVNSGPDHDLLEQIADNFAKLESDQGQVSLGYPS